MPTIKKKIEQCTKIFIYRDLNQDKFQLMGHFLSVKGFSVWTPLREAIT